MSKLETYFIPIENSTVNAIIEDVEKYLDIYLVFLGDLFGESNLSQNINISFIESVEINFRNAFTYYFLRDKIYLLVDPVDNLTSENKLAYSQTILHELTHLYINGNWDFYNALKDLWQKEYQDRFKGNIFRVKVEELIVSTLINANRKYGFALNYLGMPNDTKLEKDSLAKKKQTSITYNFLEKLKSSKDLDKLEKYFPDFIKELISIGYLEEAKIK